MTPQLGYGIYTLSEAARYAGVNPSTAYAWFKGRPDHRGRGPVFAADYDVINHDFAISFLDLIDLYVAAWFREEGVKMGVVRRAYVELSKELDVHHAFAHSRLYTDGKTIIATAASRLNDELLYDAVSKQMFFSELKHHLGSIDYSQKNHLAERWRIAPGVVLDPRRGFGKPVISETGVSASIVARQYAANAGDAELVAELFGIRTSDVENAVEFNRVFVHSAAA